MPNHVSNTIKITGTPTELQSFWKDATTDPEDAAKTEFKYTNLYPIPDGADWYFWSIKNYGNKWGNYNTSVQTLDFENGVIELSYDTAWDISTPFWKWITAKYHIFVTNYFFDEGFNFCGECYYINGNETTSLIFQNYHEDVDDFKKYAELCHVKIGSEFDNL